MTPLAKKYAVNNHENSFVQQYARLELYYELDPKFTHMSRLPQVSSCEDAHICLVAFIRKYQINVQSQEKFFALFVNRDNRLLSVQVMNIGNIFMTIVDTRAILKIALDVGAQGIVLAHNHPSGKLIPSTSDLKITSNLKEQFKVFDLELIDHIIFCAFEDEFYSFVQEGKL